jgi:hypothetical protein
MKRGLEQRDGATKKRVCNDKAAQVQGEDVRAHSTVMQNGGDTNSDGIPQVVFFTDGFFSEIRDCTPFMVCNDMDFLNEVITRKMEKVQNTKQSKERQSLYMKLVGKCTATDAQKLNGKLIVFHHI